MEELAVTKELVYARLLTHSNHHIAILYTQASYYYNVQQLSVKCLKQHCSKYLLIQACQTIILTCLTI